MKKAKYELVFSGSATATWFPRYRRWHSSIESARETVRQVRDKIEQRAGYVVTSENSGHSGLNPHAFNPLLYGKGLGPEGVMALAWEEAN